MIGNSVRKKRNPWRTATARFQQEGANLIGALADQRLQVEPGSGSDRLRSGAPRGPRILAPSSLRATVGRGALTTFVA
jgi:hypothetical protein